MTDFFEFQLRPRVLYKAGLVDDIGPEIANLGVQRALIVADEGVARAGLLDRVRAGLARSITVAGIFTEVPPNSSVAAVTRGAAYARECSADLIVAVGGGSPIDTAKAMRIEAALDEGNERLARTIEARREGLDELRAQLSAHAALLHAIQSLLAAEGEDAVA